MKTPLVIPLVLAGILLILSVLFLYGWSGMMSMRNSVPMHQSSGNKTTGTIQGLPTGGKVSDFPEVKPTAIVDLKDGDTYDLTVSRVRKKIGNSEVVMYAYNSSVPGPVIRAPKGSTVKIRLTNRIAELDATLHSHGVRLDEAFDGVPTDQGGKTPVAWSGKTVEYTVHFPDAGTFWYHPHIRDDIGQGMGLYGNYIVTDTASGFTNPVNREEYLILSDILLENGQIAPFPKDRTDHALMGRYGNTLLVNGADRYSLDAKKGDVIRLHLTNAASARTFRFGIPGVKLKLVGSDGGKYGNETFTDSVLLGPSERYIVEAYFPASSAYPLTHTTPDKTYTLGSVHVAETATQKDNSQAFNTLHTSADTIAEMQKFETFYSAQPDKNLEFSLEMKSMGGVGMMGGMMGGHAAQGGLEWEDTMGAENADSDSNSITWAITDTDTNHSNNAIDWKFRKGDLVKIRISNSLHTMHPMQHPFHIHGQRFIVLDENGKRNDNPVWKDTVLVPAGRTVNILVDMSNAGNWMAHCHIAEHLHSGMMFGFRVE